MHAPAKFHLDLKASHTVYKNAAGERLPGVTTLLGVLDKPPLPEWAAREERAMILTLADQLSGRPLADLRTAVPEPYAYTVKRDAAADAGTIAHARIHAYLRGLELDQEGLPLAALELSLNSYRRWLEWWTEQDAKCVATELPLVSESLQVGGTLDVVADTPEGLTLADVKTTKRPDPRYWPYDEFAAQVAGYRLLWNESHPWEPIQRVCICRVGKKHNDPGETTWLTSSQLKAGENLFRAALSAYRAKLVLAKLR